MMTAFATITIFLNHTIAMQVGVSAGYAGVPDSNGNPAAKPPPLSEAVTTTDKGLAILNLAALNVLPEFSIILDIYGIQGSL